MGLFSRSSPDDNRDEYESVELPTRDDLDDSVLDTESADLNIPAKPAPARTAKRQYGIEEAIELMQSLPRDNHEVVVTVVKKTLESTDIRVKDIIEDAAAKEERLRKRHKDLESDIKQLQDKIAQHNQQINELVQDLKQTTDVRKRLELALELENKSQAEPPKPQQGAMAGAESNSKPGAASANATGTASPSQRSSASTSTTGPQTAVNQSPRTENRTAQPRTPASGPQAPKNPAK